MAKANENSILKNVSGTIGGMLTVRQVGDDTVVSKKQGKRKKKGSAKQLAAELRFKEAIMVAKRLMEDPEMKAVYQAAAGPGRTAYNMALGDAYNPPEIKDVIITQYFGKVGDKIVVKAVDDFKVFLVTVSIFDHAGVLIEQGAAIAARNGKDWSYTCTKENNALKGTIIQAMAEDIPANKTYREVVLL